MPLLARRLPQALLLAGSLAVAFLAGEQAWRVLVRARYAVDLEDFAERSADRTSDIAQFSLRDGPELYGLRCGFDGSEAITNPAGGPPTVVHYRILDEGVRWHPVWPPPDDPALQRVLFVGDSYTYGSAVGNGLAFPHLIEAELRANGVPVFVINGGVPGYNSEQVLVRLRQLLPEHAPREVVYSFVLNDAEPPIGVPTPPAMIYGDVPFWLFEAGKRVGNALAAALVDDTPWLARRAPAYEKDYRRSWGTGSAKARACLEAVGAMAAACAAQGAGFSVAILPDFAQPLDDGYPYLDVHAQVRAFCAARGIPVLDLFDSLRGADVIAIRVPGDLHPNAEGHRRLAAPLAAHLVERLRG